MIVRAPGILERTRANLNIEQTRDALYGAAPAVRPSPPEEPGSLILIIRTVIAGIGAAACLASPIAAKAKPATPTKPTRPIQVPQRKLSGPGAKYLAEFDRAMRGVKGVDIRVDVKANTRPAKGKAVVTTVNMRIAWVGRDFFSHVEGAQGDVMIVGNGSGAYIYTPRVKKALKLDGRQALYVSLEVRQQLTRLLGSGPLVWNYGGVQKLGTHSVDVINSAPMHSGAQSLAESVYLDRTTHLPRRVVMHIVSPSGSADSQIDFTAFDLNPKLPANTFRFSPPPGTHIETPPSPPAAAAPPAGVPPMARRK